jgi:hypothetical protein
MLSAMMTLTAVAYAYLSDSMPEADLTETDVAFIAAIGSFKKRIVAIPPSPQILVICKHVYGFLLRRSPGRCVRKLERPQREAAVTRFILALSDQQLVVGIAILVATVTNQCTLSVNEFNVAFALVWFSATTHLATLDSLRQYFTSHPTIRNWRVFGMLAMMIMFLYCFIIVLAMDGVRNYTVPVQCYMFEFDQMFFMTNSDKDDGSLDKPDALKSRFYQRKSSFYWIIVFIYIVIGYKDRILQLYGYRTSHSYGQSAFTAKMHARFTYQDKTSKALRHVFKIPSKEWSSILEEYAEEKRSETRSRLLSSLSISRLDKWRLAESMYQHSLLPVVPPMVFMLVYGFVQMAVYRWDNPWAGSVGADANLGFGQITPLLLTALPVLAAAEIYYGTSSLQCPFRRI